MAQRTRAPRPSGLTARATVLALVLLALLLGYAYPLRVYFGQQAQIQNIEAQQELQRRKIDELAQTRAKWDDEEYIKTQVRRRLLWTAEGETPYLVIGGGPGNAPAEAPAQPATPPSQPWYGKLWSSIEAADRR